jgi:hypothetical protein
MLLKTLRDLWRTFLPRGDAADLSHEGKVVRTCLLQALAEDPPRQVVLEGLLTGLD